MNGTPSLPKRRAALCALALALAAAVPAAAQQAARTRVGSPANGPSAPPVLVDWFSPSDLAGVDLPGYGSMLWPYGLAAKSDGTLLVACGTTALAMDRSWQVTGFPAKRLSDEGNLMFAYSIQLTRAETMYLRSSDGTGLWAFADGSQEYRRVRSEGQAGSAFGILDDGTAFVLESGWVALNRSGASTRLKLPEGISPLAACAGPDESIWVSDLQSGSLVLVSLAGQALATLKLDLPPGTIPMRLRPVPEGGFLVATNQDVRRLGADGKTVWAWDGKAEGLSITFSIYTDVVATKDGLVYFNDVTGRRIFRLSERPAALPADLAAVAKASAALRSGDDKAALALADAYEAMGASEAARVALSRYLEDRPADAAVQDRRQRLEVALQKAKARAAGAEVLSQLERFGPETAREAYGRAMRAWESLRARAGGDPEVGAEMAALRAAFQAAERGPQARAPSPAVVGAELSALFPSLQRAYRDRPAGSVTVRNTLPTPITELRADLFIVKYMDFPSEGRTVARLEPGKEARLDLLALLNEAALEVREDIPLQARITVRYKAGGAEGSVELSRPVTLYRRTAMTWDDSGKLAAFVTPNDDAVSEAAFALVGAKRPETPISTDFAAAALVCDALGSLPLAYVKDPQSPIDAALGERGVVDTVRFPRTTLAYRGGDCDDTTALLSSMLEALGIPTAIMTSPGHVFLAFDSGEPSANAWLFAAPGYRALERRGTLWIPIESTVLGDGFAAAWKSASALVDKYGASVEFLPVADARASYPPLPLSQPAAAAPAPDPKRVAGRSEATISALRAELYAEAAKAIGAAIKSQSGAARNSSANRLAQLHARYGLLAEAKATLESLVGQDPSYVPALLNLAGLARRTGDDSGALAWLRRANAVSPGGSTVADYARAIGLGEAAGFGPALVGVPAKGEAGAARASEGTRASGRQSTAWAE